MKNHAAIILCNNGKVLFVQRAETKKSLPNIWAFPSGTIEKEETAEETARREAKEELNIEVDVHNILATVELPELEARLHFVTCSPLSGELTPDPSEIQAVRWMKFEEFFKEFSNDQIGHGLIYLRNHPRIWEGI